jgi:hypothetical protein
LAADSPAGQSFGADRIFDIGCFDAQQRSGLRQGQHVRRWFRTGWRITAERCTQDFGHDLLLGLAQGGRQGINPLGLTLRDANV